LGCRGRTVPYVNLAVALGINVKSEPKRLLLASAAIWDLLHIEGVNTNRVCRYFMNSIGKRIPKLRYRQIGYTPNFFLHKDIGGLGWKEFRPECVNKIDTHQKEIAEVMITYPEEIFRQESLGTTLRANELMIKKFNLMKPHCEYTNFIGPFQEMEDPATFEERYLSLCQRSTCFVKHPHKFDTDTYVFRMNLRKIEGLSKKAVKRKKRTELRNFVPLRRRVFGPMVNTRDTLNERIEYCSEWSYIAMAITWQ
jgi:hypothetical protein